MQTLDLDHETDWCEMGNIAWKTSKLVNKKSKDFMQSCFPFFVYFKCCSGFLSYFYKCSTSMAFT